MRTTVVVDELAASLIGRETVTTILAALERGGHEVTVLDLAADSFPAVMTAAQRRAYTTDQPVITSEVAKAIEVVRRTEALIFAYPSRLTALTPRLKGWLEQVFVPGVGFTLDDSGTLRPALGHIRRIVGVTFHDESWFGVHRGRDAGRRTITRALRLNTGWRTRCRFVALYGAAAASAEQRATFLSRLEHRMEQL